MASTEIMLWQDVTERDQKKKERKKSYQSEYGFVNIIITQTPNNCNGGYSEQNEPWMSRKKKKKKPDPTLV